MNFISTFDELNKLYEDYTTPDTKKLKAEVIKNLPDSYARQANKFDFVIESEGSVTVDPEAGKISIGPKAIDLGAREIAKLLGIEFAGLVEACDEKELTEAAEDDEIEIIDDEEPVEEVPAEDPVAEEEPKQTIIECSKCGALVIVDEVEVDEESDLVNVKDKCKFCEEKEGYKIVGYVIPYVAAEEDATEETEQVEDEVEAEELPEDDIAEEDMIEEDLADIARKALDKPASTKTQQRWEAELNGEHGDISDKRRKHLEKKFKQQRDWEARHETDDLEELFNISPNINLKLDGGTGNDVNVL